MNSMASEVFEIEEDEDIKRLKEVQRKMIELLDEAEYLIRITGDGKIFDRAKAYWIPHIKMALLNDTEYVGKSMVTMEDTISEIGKIQKGVNQQAIQQNGISNEEVK